MSQPAMTCAAEDRRPEDPPGGDRSPEGSPPEDSFGAEPLKEPLRRCIVSGEVRPKAELLRFVVGPDGQVVPDIKGSLPGRGLWLLPQGPILEKARKRRLFARAARRQVTVAEDLVSQISRLLRRRCLDLIGLAKRAGQVVSGFEQVRPWLAEGRAGVLLAASDGASDGRGRLKALGLALRPDLPVIDVFSSAELGAALGREGVVHAAVAEGDLARKLLSEAARLSGLRSDEV